VTLRGGRRLIRTARGAIALDASRYVERGLPRREASSQNWNVPLTVVRRLEDIEAIMQLFPFEAVGLSMFIMHEGPDDAAHKVSSQLVEHLGSLTFKSMYWWTWGARGPLDGTQVAETLGASTHTNNLRRLRVDRLRLGAQGAVALAASTHLARLNELSMHTNSLGDGGAKALTQAAFAERLTSLNLSYNSIGDEGARALAESPHVENLRHLDLGHNDVTHQGVCSLAASPHLSKLESLDLRGNHLALDAIQALAHSPYLRDLTRLELTMDIEEWWAAEDTIMSATHLPEHVRDTCRRLCHPSR